MTFIKENAEIFVPGGGEALQALGRTTDLCIAAHQDDIEIMAYGPIIACHDSPSRFFAGCVVSDGAGSPRSGPYGDCTDEEMKAIRVEEQKNAARIGHYCAQVFLQHPSGGIKDAANPAVAEDIAELLRVARPEAVYTHNFADKHDTHVAVALRVVEAVRSLPEAMRPKKLYAMEVWRGLDWLCDGDKTSFDTSPHPGLAAALLGVYDSQIAGGKRYDSAALGRRLANATFYASHDTDHCESISYGLDLTEMISGDITPDRLIRRYLDRFAAEVMDRLERLGGTV